MKARDSGHPKTVRERTDAVGSEGAAANTLSAGRPGLRAVLYLVFALSGLTGLVYEATWTRYLQLFLGHAAYAQVLVLSLFMGGMAAGALFASRLSRKGNAPLIAFEFDTSRTASGVFRHGSARISKTGTVVHHADGRTATINLIKLSSGGLSITTNGKSDAAIDMKRALGNRNAAIGSDEFTMTMIGVLPLAHAPGARTAAVIGHGSGLTTHVVLGSPTIERVDAIEIEPEMIRAARAFLPRVSRAYYDPRVRFIIEDARAFFARAPQKYDVIISEPSNPWVSGVASLFTPEFYRQAKRALAPDGLFVQWFHLYEIDRPLIASIVRGIGSVFPEYVLYAANDTDVVLVASASTNLPPLTDEVFAWPHMRAELEYLDLSSPAQLRLFRIASRKAYAPLLH